MSSARPSDLLVDDLATEAASVTEVLPAGWRNLYVPGVERPVVMGRGGVFVLDVRHASTLALGIPDVQAPRPWSHDHLQQRSVPQLTAELASQLLSWACGIAIDVTPLVVVIGEATDVVARPDDVVVVHEHSLVRYLQHLPEELDDETIGVVLEHVDAHGDLLAI